MTAIPTFETMVDTMLAFLPPDTRLALVLTPDTLIGEIELDSLEILTVMIALESRYFGFALPDDDSLPMTLGDLYTMLTRWIVNQI